MTEVEKRQINLDPARVVELYRNGKTVSEIAHGVGRPRGHGCNRVRKCIAESGRALR
jgi:hypothetical protein